MSQKTIVSRCIGLTHRLLRRVGIAKLWRRPIINLIDIGSAGGLPLPWSEHADLLHKQLRFEPREQPLQDTNITCLDFALWDSCEERDLYHFSGGGMGSSLFEQNYDYVREHLGTLSLQGDSSLASSWFERSALIGTQRVKCQTLDAVLKQQSTHYEFLKVDAQGAEFEILNGANSFLETDCLGLHLELFVIPLYKGIHLLPEVQEFLSAAGFDLVKKFPAHGSFASQHDCLFLKRGIDNRLTRTIRSVYGLSSRPSGTAL